MEILSDANNYNSLYLIADKPAGFSQKKISPFKAMSLNMN